MSEPLVHGILTLGTSALCLEADCEAVFHVSEGACPRCGSRTFAMLGRFLTDRAAARPRLARAAAATALVLLALTGCVRGHPDLWTPYDPAREWECAQLAWSRSPLTVIDDELDGVFVTPLWRTAYERCMEARGSRLRG